MGITIKFISYNYVCVYIKHDDTKNTFMSWINTTYSAHWDGQPPQFASDHPSFASEIPLSQVRTVGHPMALTQINIHYMYVSSYFEEC